MPINTIEFNTRMTGELDKAVVAKAVTGFLADNNLREKFVGAKTVLIPELEVSGLGDYDRDTGFVRGSVTVSNTPYELSMDRGRSFQLDRKDNDETGIAELAGSIISETVRTKVIPEVDAYAISKMAAYALSTDEPQTNTLSGTNYYALFSEMERSIQEVAFDEEIVAFCSFDFMAGLQNDPSISKHITVTDFKQGDVTLKVKSIDGIKLIPVPTTRMYTAFNFLDGETPNEEKGGFAPADTAKAVHLLMLPKRAVSLVKKTEKMRTFTPDQNLDADAWKFDYRIYYDLFIRNTLKTAIRVYAV